MANTITRRPLPALVLLLALLALTGIVWLRVLHRDTDKPAAAPPKTTCAPPPTTTPTRTLAAPSTMTVAVLNATNRAGIAAKARTSLISAGFKVPSAAANDKASVSISTTAEIRYGQAGIDAATLLRYYFPGSTLVREKTHSSAVTVSLGNAYQAVASPLAVQAALAKARLSVASAGTSPTASPTPSRTTASAAAC